MTLDGIYIRMSSSSKDLYWLLHFVPNKLFLQELAYKTYIHGVVASLHKEKMGLWPPFPLSTRIWKIKNIKQDKEQVNILSSFKFKEVIFWRHYPLGKLKQYLKQNSFTSKYSHEDLLRGEMSKQMVLVKYKIPTPEHMIQVDK